MIKSARSIVKEALRWGRSAAKLSYRSSRKAILFQRFLRQGALQDDATNHLEPTPIYPNVLFSSSVRKGQSGKRIFLLNLDLYSWLRFEMLNCRPTLSLISHLRPRSAVRSIWMPSSVLSTNHPLDLLIKCLFIQLLSSADVVVLRERDRARGWDQFLSDMAKPIVATEDPLAARLVNVEADELRKLSRLQRVDRSPQSLTWSHFNSMSEDLGGRKRKTLTVGVAGHDFKFLTSYIRHLQREGITCLLYTSPSPRDS